MFIPFLFSFFTLMQYLNSTSASNNRPRPQINSFHSKTAFNSKEILSGSQEGIAGYH